MPCGPAYRAVGEEKECPGELKCFKGTPGGNYSFDRQRLGADISGARCVTSTYVERYCGIFESRMILESYPPQIDCGRLLDDSILPAHLQALLSEDNLLDRVLNTDREGEELIWRHGLKLAINDPDASDLEGTGFVDCPDGELTIKEARYETVPRLVTVTVENTGSIPLRNVTAQTLIDYENRSTLIRPQIQNTTSLGTLQPGDTTTARFTVTSTPERLEVIPHDCQILDETLDDIPGT